jgi:class 3 adenylate cyclase
MLLRIMLCFAGMIAAVGTWLLAWLIAGIHGVEYQLSLTKLLLAQFLGAVPFALLFFLNFPMRLVADRERRKLLMQHLAFFSTTVLGVAGNLLMVAELPSDFNAFVSLLWFVFGFTFFNLNGARFFNVIFYGCLYVFGLFMGMLWLKIDVGSDEYVSYLFMVMQLLLFTPIALMSRNKSRAIQHAFRQLGKVFYSHQLQHIRSGRELEDTMPTDPSTAFVISFDIIASTRIEERISKDFFRAVFQRCNAIMIQGYDGRQLMARAYRIKEMGDGFLCSVGYPFRSPDADLAMSALRLAEEFFQAFRAEAQRMDSLHEIHCGIGIASGPVCGFYPATVPKEYDLHGLSIVLAKRYESMRKLLLPPDSHASIVILQEQVFQELKAETQSQFLLCDLKEKRIVVRDDPAARYLFYKTMSGSVSAQMDAPSQAS